MSVLKNALHHLDASRSADKSKVIDDLIKLISKDGLNGSESLIIDSTKEKITSCKN